MRKYTIICVHEEQKVFVNKANKVCNKKIENLVHAKLKCLHFSKMTQSQWIFVKPIKRATYLYYRLTNILI